ncbi:hypothetical protein OUZ56_028331 [Daphnia magna]|uniref:Uncharacterized protein n=1 Tax=Daphnia magna TaxID=35525 RepID=A0ABR0B3K3_9CRUS|nr:hypothetical protein OUZ56_028331 [Daphnia magna]
MGGQVSRARLVLRHPSSGAVVRLYYSRWELLCVVIPRGWTDNINSLRGEQDHKWQGKKKTIVRQRENR